jgi:hypothetical protein
LELFLVEIGVDLSKKRREGLFKELHRNTSDTVGSNSLALLYMCGVSFFFAN